MRSRRPAVLWCLHAIEATRVHRTASSDRDAPRRNSKKRLSEASTLEDYYRALHESRWPVYVQALISAARVVADHLDRGDPCFVHCSDGWDRTPQVCALAQLIVDPYYRTLRGFAVLIEKDFCAFGHPFE